MLCILYLLHFHLLASSCSRTVTPSSIYLLLPDSHFSLSPKQKLPAATRGSQPGALEAPEPQLIPGSPAPDRGHIHPSVSVCERLLISRVSGG